MTLALTPPKKVTFLISVALAVVAVVLRFLAYMGIDVFHTGGFVILLLGYLVLLAGNALRGV
jgi:hypothetical protein